MRREDLSEKFIREEFHARTGDNLTASSRISWDARTVAPLIQAAPAIIAAPAQQAQPAAPYWLHDH